MIIPDNIIDHLGKIWEGEYDITITKDNLSVLDLGANVGMFSFWALCKWSTCSVTCFEPLPSNADLLTENLKVFKNRVAINRYAVGKEHSKRDFYLGKHNCGEGSLFRGEEQLDDKIEVDVVAASIIPHHDIVKIDVEGAEVEVLENLTFKPFAYMIEYNSAKNRLRILELLNEDYALIDHKIYNYGSGVMKFARKDTLKK